MASNLIMNPWDVDAAIRRAYTKEYCLAPDAGASSCSGGIVRAHSVQGALLRRIARDGHVYRGSATMQNILKNPEVVTFALTGINSASTFTGFCNLHDTKIFEPIERSGFVAGPEQCFLLAYRAVCRDLFIKRATLETARWLIEKAAPGNEAIAQANLELIKIALRDFQWHKDAFDRDFRASNYSAIEWVAIELLNTPDFACSGVCYPDYDFGGQQLQNLADLQARMALVTFSVIPTNQGGIVVFAWHSSSSHVGWQLAKSLSAIDNSLLPHAIVRFAFSYSDNTCISPSWWEGLSPEIRQALQRRSFIAASPHHPSDGSWLLDDGLRAVNWKIGRVS